MSFSKQERYCNHYCKEKNMIVHEIHKEFSSGFAKQKILSNIIKSYKNINLIIYDVSRFSRSSEYGRKLFNECILKNIRLHFVREEIILDKESVENMKFSNALNASENEWHGIRTRILNNIQLRRLQNMVLGKVPFGFDCYNKKLIKNNSFNAIALIVALRNGNKSINEVRAIMMNFTSNSDALEFYDDDKVITHFSKPYTLSFVEISEILNDFGILNKTWTPRFVRDLYNKYAYTVDFVADTKKADEIVKNVYKYTGVKRPRDYDYYEL